MPEPRFEGLRLSLLRSGVATAYVDRTIVELTEHYTDLESDALAAGQTPAEAAATALATLGDERAIAAAVLTRRELLAWSTRHPRIAHCLHSAAAIGAVPGMPLMFCIEHRPELARWSAALGAAATLMSSILAGLNWLILLA